MKHLVYIGNRLAQKHKTQTTIDTLGKQLEDTGFTLSYASSYKNVLLRCLDMLFTVFKHRKTVDYVLIDTYSTLNFYYAYLVSRLCYRCHIKYIPILHGGNLPERLLKSPKYSRRIFSNAYVNVAPSHYLMSRFKDLGYSNLEYIPNSIEIKNYSFKPRQIDDIKLLWVRSFSNMYNPQLAVKLVKALKEVHIDARLCMIGPDNDGSMLSTKALAASLGVPVEFTGKLTKTQWHKKAEDFNVFINTTTIDNTPVSVVEAMALGLPVISTDVGGIPFLINDGTDGLLVPSNNVEAFKIAILKLTQNQASLHTMVKKARRKVEAFDWDTVKEKWRSVLS